MNGFLGQVAADLYGRYGDGLSSLHVMFPSRRAGLFFGTALSQLIDRPIWQPASTTIDSLAAEMSGLAVGERLRLVVELYKIYAEFHPAETFDRFYFWGELLLGDFDSIDKYMIDADTLFSNLVDLHELDDRFDYLSDEQKGIIEKFWGSFGHAASPEQHDFITVWRTLAPVYHRFRARLRKLGIAYQGMVYREAAERIRDGRVPQIPERHYVIAGFNALSKCEQVIFDYLQKNFEVDFYWDHDLYYTADTPLARAQEAGRFMRDNLRRFPSKPLSEGYDNFVKPKRIRSVAAGSDVLGCKYAGQVLSDIAREKGVPPGRETAIVLADESLLVPLLWSVPPDIEGINVTMGYPLRMHPSYTFVERLLELQNRRRQRPQRNDSCQNRGSLMFYHSDVEGLLRHPYLAETAPASEPQAHNTLRILNRGWVYINAAHLCTSPLFEKIFTAPEGWRATSDYLIEVTAEVAQSHSPEFFAIISDHIRTLANSLDGCGIDISPKTYTSLLRRSLQSVTVPFEGEPLEGVQVMGILETRALDFENIVFLSAGDSSMPGNLVGAPSFIPYNLKMAYGLPTPEHHESVWAYHFFRLIQRARRIDMVWSSTADDRSTGEPSRYVLQLDYESPHTVEKESVTVDVNLSPTEPIVVEKDEAIMEALGDFLRPEPSGGEAMSPGCEVSPPDQSEPTPSPAIRRMSPSLFFSYVECPLKFYFRAVARLKADDEVAEEVDNAMFGNLLHRAMQLLYTPLVGISNPQEHIRALIGSAKVEEAVTAAVTELYTREEGALPEDWGGSIVLAHKTIVDYIDRNILPFDASRTESYTIEKLEADVSAGFDFGASPHPIRFRGIADRIDRLADGTLRVIDYKTGSPKTKNSDNERFTDIEALFAGSADKRISAVLQTLLYAMMLRAGGAGKVQPALYYIKNLSKEGYSPLILDTGESRPVEDYADYAPEFEDHLRATLADMFDPAVAFTQCADSAPCTWCDYNAICHR